MKITFAINAEEEKEIPANFLRVRVSESTIFHVLYLPESKEISVYVSTTSDSQIIQILDPIR